MRLKTAIWVRAYLRRCAAEGAYAAIARHGDDDAGAVFIKVRRGDGACRLFEPAPAGLDGADEDRRWRADMTAGRDTDAAVESRLAREENYDGDHWVIEVEDREGRHFLEDWIAA